ncbi:lysophospholipid acyltransferase family protein [Flammeovirga sp. SJP92]|uniref:LpxL/LpxP family acyltransferase n=1 Tax=Flammeovirga sp. SJP92 TaxID=1775430 RepID=UPI000787B168|nr:lysophospholipid acyltransferase family protein [Flammeovirga sp. SJP92]KXX71698.1 hypothetical protein AVL50_05340 [Flammeovirga sp. SJP92]
MSVWSGKTKGGVLGYSIFIFFLKNFGVGPASALLYLVVPYYVLFDPKSSRISYRFYKERLGFSTFKAAKHIFTNRITFGRVLLDKFAMMTPIKERYTFDCDGEERLHALGETGKGGMIITAHIGNWEIAGQLLDRLSTKIHVVMFDAEYQKIKALVSSQLGNRNFNVIAIKEDMSHIFLINKALKNGEILCIQGDRFLSGAPTLELDFLGEKALFPKSVFDMASRLKVPVCFAFAMKDKGMHYKLNSSVAYEGMKSKELAEQYIKLVEQKVQDYPEQWFNFYDFWKK